MAKATAKILKETDKDFSGKSELLIKFLELYVEYNGDNKQAWLESGYSPAKVHTSMSVVRDNWRLVEKLIRNKIGSHVPMALAGVVELAQNAKQESVRLKALQDVLYRAGYDRPIEIQHTEKEANELSNRELDDELTRLLARVNDTADAEKELH